MCVKAREKSVKGLGYSDRHEIPVFRFMRVYEVEFEIRLNHFFSLTLCDVESLLLFSKPQIR